MSLNGWQRSKVTGAAAPPRVATTAADSISTFNVSVARTQQSKPGPEGRWCASVVTLTCVALRAPKDSECPVQFQTTHGSSYIPSGIVYCISPRTVDAAGLWLTRNTTQNWARGSRAPNEPNEKRERRESREQGK